MKSIRGCIFLTIILSVIELFALEGDSIGYERRTHRRINNAISDNSVMDEYFFEALLRPINAKGRISETFAGKTPYQLFEDAGDAEDGWPLYFRAWNHYHDPTKSWEQAGYTNPVLPNGLSSILWAQYNRHPSPPLLISGVNVWTWDAAYAFFHLGLAAADNATRNQNLADLFSALGHLPHLVADMSVPAHSRNDAHLLYNYEDWCYENLKGLTSTAMGKEAYRSEFAPVDAIFTQYQVRFLPGDVPLSPASNLWDTHPAPTVDAAAEWDWLKQNATVAGLSEYSSYNYLSDDTVFTDYVYPRREEVGVWLVPRTARDGQTDYLLYFKRPASDGILVRYLAATDLVFLDQQAPLDNSLRYVAAHLDANCYEDYASNLVPRAVSYGMELG